MKTKVIFTCLFLLFTFANVDPARSNIHRHIMEIGCHLNDGTCYVTIDGEQVGPESCKSTSIRWNKETSVSGKETFSLLMTAFAAGHLVQFRVLDSCYESYPTFSYIKVIK